MKIIRNIFLVVVAALVIAFFTNISESKFRDETRGKLETVAEKIVDEQHNALLSLLFPSVKNVILDRVDITVKNYYVCSVAYVSLPTDRTLSEWHDQLIGVSVFGQVFFPDDDRIMEEVRRVSDKALK
jgi:hypothetical protein